MYITSIWVEYEFSRQINNNFTSKVKYIGRYFISKIDAKMQRHGAAHDGHVCVNTKL